MDEPQTDICIYAVKYDNGRLYCKWVYTYCMHAKKVINRSRSLL